MRGGGELMARPGGGGEGEGGGRVWYVGGGGGGGGGNALTKHVPPTYEQREQQVLDMLAVWHHSLTPHPMAQRSTSVRRPLLLGS